MTNFNYLKFRAINKNLINSLVMGTINFTPPHQLNDPFDCQIDLRKVMASVVSQLDGEAKTKAIKLSTRENLFEDLQNSIAKVGICSFSLNMEETLMWTHYADNHKGLCVLYSFPESFFEDEKNEILGVDKVSYGQNPLSNWLKQTISTSKINDSEAFFVEVIKILLMTKSSSWHYEEEARIIRFKSGPLQIPKTFIKQICFGLQTPQNDVELIREITGTFDDDIEFYKVVRGADDFGTTVVEI